MGDLLKINIAVPYMAEVLTEVFCGGPEICMKVKEEEVQEIFELIASRSGDSGGGRSELFITLQAMAKVYIHNTLLCCFLPVLYNVLYPH